jgi:hypothetical protein
MSVNDAVTVEDSKELEFMRYSTWPLNWVSAAPQNVKHFIAPNRDLSEFNLEIHLKTSTDLD